MSSNTITEQQRQEGLHQYAVEYILPEIIGSHLKTCKRDDLEITFNTEKEKEDFYKLLCNYKKDLEHQMKLCDRAIRNVATDSWNWKLDGEIEV